MVTKYKYKRINQLYEYTDDLTVPEDTQFYLVSERNDDSQWFFCIPYNRELHNMYKHSVGFNVFIIEDKMFCFLNHVKFSSVNWPVTENLPTFVPFYITCVNESYVFSFSFVYAFNGSKFLVTKISFRDEFTYLPVVRLSREEIDPCVLFHHQIEIGEIPDGMCTHLVDEEQFYNALSMVELECLI